ncbi:hypothetical protein GQ85_26820 [Rhodococcus rhodochrous]|nr:hypothetical protein GQ85_26820 [Rhodococcus rhodochrous]
MAAAMRAHAVAGPLDVATAGRWLRGAEPMPDWVCELLARKAVRAARRCARSEARRFEEEHADLLRSERVHRLLESGKRRRFDELEMITVRGVAFRAAKDLARGATAGDLSDGERAALRIVGVEPGLPRRWPTE